MRLTLKNLKKKSIDNRHDSKGDSNLARLREVNWGEENHNQEQEMITFTNKERDRRSK